MHSINMKITKIIALLLAAVTISLVFCGCDPLGFLGDFFSKDDNSNSSAPESSPAESSAAQNFPVTVAGVTLNAAPRKAVSLSPFITEIIFDLGYGDRLIGVSEYCDYPSEAKLVEKMGSSVLPDINAIALSGAEVLFVPSPLSERDTEDLTSAGVKIIVLEPVRRLSALEKLYRNIAAVFGGAIDGAGRASVYYNECTDILSDCTALVSSLTKGEKLPRVLYIRYESVFATVDTLEGNLLEQMGFENSASGYGEWNFPVDMYVSLKPDYVICDKSLVFDSLPVYESVKDQVKSVSTVNAALLERQSKRSFSALYDAISSLVD